MAILFSKKFNIPKERLAELGVFDVFLDKDSSFFINIKRLQYCTIPEFSKSYESVNRKFREITLLLQNAQPEGKLYNEAYKKFNYPEVNGINLGFASGRHGAGFGTQLRKKIIKDAYEIIKSGCVQPEIFHLVSLFEENVGPDRLSDMVARIIYPDILAYSRRVYRELNINPETYSQFRFKNGILINPYKRRCFLLLLPECILHKLPIAHCWDDIERVCAENAAIRAQMNEVVRIQWLTMNTITRKTILREQVFKNPDKADKIIEAYKSGVADEYTIYQNPEYITDYLKSTYSFPINNSKCSFDAAISIINSFKEWVEYHRGATVINGCSAKPTEKLVQLMIYGVAQMFCENFNWDFSPETDSGRGSVDFKISRGNDKTVIEVKLSSNQECVHGLEVQIEEYAKAENTENKVFLLVVIGSHSKRIQAVIEKKDEMLTKGLKPAKIIIINAVPKIAASKYRPVK